MDSLATTLLRLLRFNREMLNRTLDGLPDSALDERIAGVGNSPRWVLLHLAAMFDVTLRNLGRPTCLPGDRVAPYAPGSDGAIHHQDGLRELRATLDRVLDAYHVEQLSIVRRAAGLARII